MNNLIVNPLNVSTLYKGACTSDTRYKIHKAFNQLFVLRTEHNFVSKLRVIMWRLFPSPVEDTCGVMKALKRHGQCIGLADIGGE